MQAVFFFKKITGGCSFTTFFGRNESLWISLMMSKHERYKKANLPIFGRIPRIGTIVGTTRKVVGGDTP